jgi:serine/threonine-protein kinase HipA
MKSSITLNHSLVEVSITSTDGTQAILGNLGLKDRRVFFEYDSGFITKNIHPSPLKLPVRTGVHIGNDLAFDGLFGLFADSLPDGWGKLLIDRFVQQQGINPRELTSLDRLTLIGDSGTGALCYRPNNSITTGSGQVESLDVFSRYTEIVLKENEPTPEILNYLYPWGGSSLGARPKLHCYLNDSTTEVHALRITAQREEHSSAWIIKFPALYDSKDIGAVEYAYHLMARAAGLRIPTARLLDSKNSPGYFAVKRFDRTNDDQRIHTHSASGLLHSDHRYPSMDYQDLLRATLYLTQDMHEVKEQVRLMVFNILSHNRDDHSRNFSFLMSHSGTWTVSPAYDLTFAPGMGGEHASMILGEGTNPTASHVMKLTEKLGIKKAEVVAIIDQTTEAISKWEVFAKESNVGKKTCRDIGVVLKATLERFVGK